MDPIWLIPTAICVPVFIWKAVDLIRYVNRKDHLFRMGIYICSAFILYWVLYWLGLGISRRLASAAWISDHVISIHSIIIGSLLSGYTFLVYMARREVKRVGTPTLEKLRKLIERVNATAKQANARSNQVAEEVQTKYGKVERDLQKKYEELENRVKRKYEEVKSDAQEKYEETNKRIDALDGVVDDHEETMKKYVEKMEKIGNQIEEQANAVSDLKGEVESLRGKKSEEEGLKWQDELARRVRTFGYEAEVNPKEGADLVVKEPASGFELAVVSAKAYNLRSRRGLTGEIEPEVQRAEKDGLPLVVAVKNKLNDQEIYHFCEPEYLDEFTCSAPGRLTGEKITQEQKVETQKGREAFRNLLVDRTP
ncbi:hypothetical protein AKJ65_02845 [candidate division MSBL1 archaeon SCGC-AAA259E19]|uniref:Uncharacterized protein n=1 Tax=candidate division MSBL1 archaeon SCGC-AAA259E19 TaxID=1698264 RepID=A0A133ULL1_9EURY|nr:hypothetical protein AKJ65_02845 [candidate division MSBL1 archaeon SCGC-AAA259E19]